MSARETVRSTTLGATAAAFWLAGAALPAFAAGPLAATPFDASGMTAIPEVTVEAPVLAPQLGMGTGAGFIDGAGLKQYAMSDHQLGNVRGGFFLPSGIGLSFGFQQLTSVNGRVVQGILVPITPITSGGTLPVYVVGPQVTVSDTAATTGASTPGGPSSTGAGSFSSAANVSLHQVSGSYNGYSYQYSGGTLSFTPSGEPTTTLQGSSPAITVSSDTNSGQTAIQTVLNGNGLFNSIANSANNQVITQATALSINVTGLAQSMAASQAVNSIQNSIARAIRVP